MACLEYRKHFPEKLNEKFVYPGVLRQAVVEEACSPPPILEETEVPLGSEVPPSPARSTSSSSSGSYDLKDAMADPGHELEQRTAPPSGHTSEAELDRDVRRE